MCACACARVCMCVYVCGGCRERGGDLNSWSYSRAHKAILIAHWPVNLLWSILVTSSNKRVFPIHLVLIVIIPEGSGVLTVNGLASLPPSHKGGEGGSYTHTCSLGGGRIGSLDGEETTLCSIFVTLIHTIRMCSGPCAKCLHLR